MRVGTYGDGGAGSLDFDNIEIRYGLAGKRRVRTVT
jgi:hypothetical protein